MGVGVEGRNPRFLSTSYDAWLVVISLGGAARTAKRLRQSNSLHPQPTAIPHTPSRYSTMAGNGIGSSCCREHPLPPRKSRTTIPPDKNTRRNPKSSLPPRLRFPPGSLSQEDPRLLLSPIQPRSLRPPGRLQRWRAHCQWNAKDQPKRRQTDTPLASSFPPLCHVACVEAALPDRSSLV